MLFVFAFLLLLLLWRLLLLVDSAVAVSAGGTVVVVSRAVLSLSLRRLWLFRLVFSVSGWLC
jgi:hypothetical protein